MSNADQEISKLIRVINALQNADLDNLIYPDFVANQIRSAGLVFDHRNLYGSDNQYMNCGHEGLWQMPIQLAKCLVHLTNYRINSAIEVGTWSGWTISLMTAYLLRFNPNLSVLTVDTGDAFGFASSVIIQLLPISVHVGTAQDFAGQAFDLAFIDGDHSYASCRGDYEAIGRIAKICMLHDINDKYVASHPANDGGVPRFWRELTYKMEPDSARYEFLDHSEGDSVMGIGLLVRSPV